MRLADILYLIPYLLVVILLTVMIGFGRNPHPCADIHRMGSDGPHCARANSSTQKRRVYFSCKGAGRLHAAHLDPPLDPQCDGTDHNNDDAHDSHGDLCRSLWRAPGQGVQAPIASWGTMASDGLSALSYYPWRLFFPASFICLTMLCFNVIGDGLRDAFDPRIAS